MSMLGAKSDQRTDGLVGKKIENQEMCDGLKLNLRSGQGATQPIGVEGVIDGGECRLRGVNAHSAVTLDLGNGIAHLSYQDYLAGFRLILSDRGF